MFSVPQGTGYVLQSTDGNTLCLAFALDATGTSPGTDVANGVGCGSTAAAEEHGLSVQFLGDTSTWVGLVPSGGSVDLTVNGTTTAVPIDSGGIATVVVDQPATVTVHIGATTTANEIGPWQPPSGRSTGSTGGTPATP